MKTCPACNLDFEDEFVFCPEDGARLDYNADLTSERIVSKTSAFLFRREVIATPTIQHCPVCQRDYPLTFSCCPVDGFRLSREKIIVARKQEEPAMIESGEEAAPSFADEMDAIALAAFVEVENPIAEPRWSPLIEKLESLKQPLMTATARLLNFYRRSIASRTESLSDIADDKSFDKSFNGQVAAIDFSFAVRATVVGLSLFGILVAYSVYDYLSRRPAVKPRIEKAERASETSPFIPTPQSARDYVEETPPQPVDADDSDDIEEREPRINAPTSPRKTKAERALLSYAPTRAVEPSKPAPRPAVTRESVPTVPVRSRSTGGQIDARLLRVRSVRTRPGVRYDLTFMLEDRADTTVRWERMIIATRSASGGAYTSRIPFYHRQGASGSLTFTVSVEMFGPKPADLKGRVVCTTIGSDRAGRQMTASFGANVAP
jgi:hypothetical protein